MVEQRLVLGEESPVCQLKGLIRTHDKTFELAEQLQSGMSHAVSINRRRVQLNKPSLDFVTNHPSVRNTETV
jgi:hypothetical protein